MAIYNLFNICRKIRDNNVFFIYFFQFQNYIIKVSLSFRFFNFSIQKSRLLMFFFKFITDNLDKFSKFLIINSNYVVRKVQIYFPVYVTLCFVYGKNTIKCCFNFFGLNIKETYTDKARFIYF